MSDTPRTDIEAFDIMALGYNEYQYESKPDGEYVYADLARELELDIAALKAELEAVTRERDELKDELD